MTKPKPKAADLVPIDWDVIEPHFRAGLLTYKELAGRFGVSASAIFKHFDKLNIKRDLLPRIQARTQEKLNASVAAASGNAERGNAEGKRRLDPFTEKVTVEATAELMARVWLGHRTASDDALEMVNALLVELRLTMQAPEVFAQVQDILACSAEPQEGDVDKLRTMAELVASLPQREKVARGILESMHRAMTMQRLAYGMDDKQKPPEASDSFESLRDLAASAP